MSRTSFRRFTNAMVLALAVIVPTACAAGPGASPSGPAAEREPLEQSFGPAFLAQPPAGRRTRVDRATLSPDRVVLTIEFIGGKGYLASDPCSTDYEPWIAPRGDELDLAVVQITHPDQLKLGPNQGCTMEGYGWIFHLTLPTPYTGTTVNDLAIGGRLLVGAPPDTAHVTTMPSGWRLQSSFAQEAGPPPIWVEIYAAGPVERVGDEGPGQLVLYQAFGITGEWTDTRALKSQQRGGIPTDVTFRGQPATVWVDSESGELLLAWDANDHSYGLIGNLADMTVEQLVSCAESVASRP